MLCTAVAHRACAEGAPRRCMLVTVVVQPQAGNNAVPMRPGTGASPSLQAMRERAREAAEAALAEQSAPQHAAVRSVK